MTSLDPSYLPISANSTTHLVEDALPPVSDHALPYSTPDHSYWTKHYKSELTRWNWGGYGGTPNWDEKGRTSSLIDEGQEGDNDEGSACSESSWEMVDEAKGAQSGGGDCETDIVVIGSGLTGTSCVDKLVEELSRRSAATPRARTVKISVLEAREFCSGATARNGGHLTPSPIFTFSAISKKAGSVSDAVKSVALEARGVATILNLCESEGWEADVDLVQGGLVGLFATEAQEAVIKGQIDGARKAGVDVSSLHWLSSQEAKEEYDAVCHSAVRAPGNNLYPLKYVTKLFQRAQARAAASKLVHLELFTGTPVMKVEKVVVEGLARWRVSTNRGTFSAKQVIHCTNAYASYLIPSLRSGPARIIPVRGQVISVDSSKRTHWTNAFSAREGDEYYFQRPVTESSDGEIILGGCRVAAGKGSLGSGKWGWEMNVVNDSEVSKKVGMSLRKYLGWQFPDLGFGEVGKGGAAVKEEWSGIMGYRESGVPIVGRVYDAEGEVEGQYVSAGYTGHGMPRAPACGEIIANMVLADLDGTEFTVPDWMPEYYLSKPIEAEKDGRRWCVVS